MHRVHLKDGPEGLCGAAVNNDNTLTADLDLVDCVQCTRLSLTQAFESQVKTLEFKIDSLKEQLGILLMAFIEEKSHSLGMNVSGSCLAPSSKDGSYYRSHWYETIELTSNARGSSGGVENAMLNPELDPKKIKIEAREYGYYISYNDDPDPLEIVEDHRPTLWSLL